MPPTESATGAQGLEALIGEWTVEVIHPGVSPDPIPGRQRFEWILDGQFVLQHWTIDHPDFPNAIAVLSPDASHYFDTRGVARRLHMTIGGGVWRLWREDADFWQRFIGEQTTDGTVIAGAWETSHDDGATWVHDFAMNYTRTA